MCVMIEVYYVFSKVPLIARILLKNNQQAREPTPMVQHGPEHKR